METNSVHSSHAITETDLLIPSASRWNSIELDFKLAPKSSNDYASIPSPYTKSFDYSLAITDKKLFKRFIFVSVSLFLIILAIVLLLHFLPHKRKHHGPSKNLTLALNQALTFFDAQKSGFYPKNSPVKFRGDSGLDDGENSTEKPAKLVGGFYDSGNNIKFSFPTAYTVTLLSWSVIEYHVKYVEIGELDHVKDIIRWGTDYLLKVFVPPNSTSGSTMTLYSQVGGGDDIKCWQRPEDMDYQRPVSICDSTASDLAGEVVAALSAASLVFKQHTDYSSELTDAAANLYELVTREDPEKRATYNRVEACGGKEARRFYPSSGYKDELVWAGTWLFLATGNVSYLRDATEIFGSADANETISDKGIFYWNNKLPATAILLTRIRYFHDPGFYEDALRESSNITDSIMCLYLSHQSFRRTPGGLILLRPDNGTPLQFAATASFLSKLYSDYLHLLRRSGGRCKHDTFSVQMLHSFSLSQVNYILGVNPKKMSYMVGFGDEFPSQVHHRSASIPWDGKRYFCVDGERWLNSKDRNPQVLVGAMVGGPDQKDNFLDQRDKPEFTEPSMASNSGLVAALVALHDAPKANDDNLGIDMMGIFGKVHLTPTGS